MRQLEYSPEAEDDLAAIGAYVAERAGDFVAHNLLDRIRIGIESMAHFPGSCQLVPELGADLRRLVIGRYSIFYRFDDEMICIVRVLHGARDISARLFET